ncbi:hypothetical protein OEZ86_000169 [Tetradesmus obliquus]|nr:hypothetical protein OEZ86_000169 [Tetradesmus obliquus]
MEEDSKMHRHPISHLQWDAAGTCLLTTDTQGKVVVWEVDRHQQLQPKGSVAEKGCTITHAVIASRLATGINSQQGAAIAYYAISTQGSGTVTIKWLDEQGRSGIVQDIGENLLALLHYSERQQLVAVTGSGSAMVLGSNSSTGSAAAAAEWGVLMRVKFAGVSGSAKLQVGKLPSTLCWGPSAQLLAASCGDGLQLCTRALLHHKLCEGFAVMQESAGRVLLEQLEGPPKPPGRISTSLQLAGLDVTANALLLHDGRQAHVYRISESDNSLTQLSQSESPGLPVAVDAKQTVEDGTTGCGVTVAGGNTGCCSMALYNESVYRTAERRVEVCNLSGVVKQTLMFDEGQGQPLLLDTNNEYLAVLTSTAQVRVFRLAGREAKPHAGPGPLLAAGCATDGLQLDAIRVNCNGTMVCAVGNQPGSGGCQDPRLFAYSADTNGPLVFDFTKDLRAPRTVSWDLRDPRLLAVQTCQLSNTQGSSQASSDNSSGGSHDPGAGQQAAPPANGCTAASIAVMFATADAGLLLQEYQDVQQAGSHGFLGVSAPHLLLHKKSLVSAPGAPSYSSNVTRVPLLGFSGLGSVDDATRAALLDFNYLLAVGRLEEAFRAVAALRSPAVWRSMAHMAIKNKRLDVAEHCLGNMEHVRGARALRESAAVPQLDARVGLVAVQLGLADDAARLFSACERWDLLEQLHMAAGRWEAALDVAAKQDRIHLQCVHHAYARHLEAIGDLKGAMQHYMESGTAASEVPRMLWQLGELPELEQLVLQSCEPGLLTWWARFCESKGRFEQALGCYQRAGNQLAALRIHCATGNWQAAEELMAASQDPAAAFHLARLYEAQGKVPEALRCYSTSKRYSHGARLAKRYGMDQELLSLALKSPPGVMLEAADHLLAAGNAEAAALLYQKGGKLGKALEMALGCGLYGALDSIAEALDKDQDPMLMARCAEAFVSAGHHAKAVSLLVRAGEPARALELLLQHEVPLSEELAEALTPEKTPDNADSRSSVLMRIAQAAKHQGLYHLACKKYTQAGDRLKAMKALIKSGDTDKIVFFAGVSRQNEVYIMAANYLQSLDWRANPELLKHILGFYTKARAADRLAGFYSGCAQLEIDDFKEYGKALQALQEAAKHLAKSRVTDREAQMAALDARIQRIQRFCAARDMLPSDPAGAVTICQQLLQELPDQQDPAPNVRAGDIYALLVDWCCQQGNMQQALQLIQQMADNGLQPQAFLSQATAAQVQQATGVQLPTFQQQQQQQPAAHAAAATEDDIADEVGEQLPFIQDQDDDYAGG